MLVGLQPGRRLPKGAVHAGEAPSQPRVADDHEPRVPGPIVERPACVAVARVPGDSLAWLHRGVLAPPSIGGTPVVLQLDVADADAACALAIAAGAEARQPPADMFWGARHGQLADPFGHRWNISQHLRDVPHAEQAAAVAAMFADKPAPGTA